MFGDVIHVSALREQIVDFTQIGISDNFRHPVWKARISYERPRRKLQGIHLFFDIQIMGK